MTQAKESNSLRYVHSPHARVDIRPAAGQWRACGESDDCRCASDRGEYIYTTEFTIKI